MHDHAADDALLQVFKQLGVNLQEPREVIFFLIFANERDADGGVSALAQKKLVGDKYRIDAPWWKRLFAKPRWGVAVTRQMPLDEAKLKSITTHFQEIAKANNGSYDGWEANVSDTQIDASQLQQA